MQNRSRQILILHIELIQKINALNFFESPRKIRAYGALAGTYIKLTPLNHWRPRGWLIRSFQTRILRDKSGSCSRLKLRELCRRYREPGHPVKRRETHRGFSPAETFV